MEKLKLGQENELVIYCFSLRPRSTFDAHKVPPEAKFFLGYDLEGVNEEVAKRYPGIAVDIIMHSHVPFKNMLDKVELPPAEPFESPIKAFTPEYNRMQFMNGLRLVMDRYVELPADRETLNDILDRVDIQKVG